MGFPGGSGGKEPACNVGDLNLIPGSGRSPGEGNGHLFKYSCLENSMDRGAWWATSHRVKKSQTRLSDFTFFLLLSLKTHSPIMAMLFLSNKINNYFPISANSLYSYSTVQFSHSVLSDSLRPHGLQNARLPCPSPTP